MAGLLSLRDIWFPMMAGSSYESLPLAKKILLNDQQRDSTAKYLNDLSKGIALLSVIKSLWEPGAAVLPIMFGMTAPCLFFSWGYVLEGRK
jgi:hypothetical protein